MNAEFPNQNHGSTAVRNTRIRFYHRATLIATSRQQRLTPGSSVPAYHDTRAQGSGLRPQGPEASDLRLLRPEPWALGPAFFLGRIATPAPDRGNRVPGSASLASVSPLFVTPLT